MDNLVGKTISHYKIVELLGSGGMGVVYRAEDTRLERTVALKFLPPELTRDEETRERFLREARAASAMEHNNICAIHEIDQTEDEHIFIVMAHYQGETLKEKIKSGPMRIKEAIDLAIQIAMGLDQAHHRAIVHRDIKPGNIFVTGDGTVKILDFGLAKVSGQSELTVDGAFLGTASYMSPEQGGRGLVDHRTDIWSLGVILYEMIAGQHPFRSHYEQATLYSIINEEPEPVTGLRDGVPVELEQILTRAMAKDPGERYQHAGEMIADMQSLRKCLIAKSNLRPAGSMGGSRKRWMSSPILWIVGAVIVGLAAGLIFYHPEESISFSQRDWILITDFKNLTGEEIFDRSLNTALTVSIQQSQYVNVFPRSRVRETLKRMKREEADTLDEKLGSEVALREGLKAMVVPSISSIGDIYHLSAEIVDPSSRVSLRTEKVRAEGREEVLSALDELARKIREDLGESLPSISNRNVFLPRATTSSLEALKYFTDGSISWGKGKHMEAAALWHKAIEKDSTFAWAHASLGVYYYWRDDRPRGESHFARALNLLDHVTEREKLWIQSMVESYRGNREKSLQILKIYVEQYPDSREAWFNMGIDYRWLGQFDKALESYRKVLELDPDMARAYINISTCYSLMHRYEEAVANYQRGFELQPEEITSGTINHEFGFAYVELGEFGKAEKIFRRMFSEDDWKKARGHRSLALLNMYRGKYSDAIANLKEAILLNRAADQKLSELRDHLYLAVAYKTKGMLDQADEQLRVMDQMGEEIYLAPYWLMILRKVYARMGDTVKTARMAESVSKKMNEQNRLDRAALKLLQGELELARGNHDRALSLFEMAYKLREDNYALESLANGYLISGQPDRAAEKHEELIGNKSLGWEAQQYWIMAHQRLGRIYLEEERIEKAIEYYDTFLDIWREGDRDLPALVRVKKRLAELKGQI